MRRSGRGADWASISVAERYRLDCGLVTIPQDRLHLCLR